MLPWKVLAFLSALAENGHELITRRANEGRKTAKLGRVKFSPRPKWTMPEFSDVLRQFKSNVSCSAIVKGRRRGAHQNSQPQGYIRAHFPVDPRKNIKRQAA